MIIHGNFSVGKFWPVVIKGARLGAEETGLTLEIHDIELNNMKQMSELIESAVASKPDGMIISLPDPTALAPAVQKINDAKIPFIVINAGAHDAKKMGALTYVGQFEYEAGFAAGERMAEAGVRNAYCVNHQPKNAAINDRCNGFTDAITRAGGTVETLVVDKSNLPEAKQRIVMALQLDPNTDGIMVTTDLVNTDLTVKDLPIPLQAIQESGITRKVMFASFDFSPKTLDAIKTGKMAFAIDQQQYLQGYLPMIILNLYLENANTMYQDLIATGPQFITLENVERVKNLADTGTR
jgi:simple sugar transport system substrate-binding protein